MYQPPESHVGRPATVQGDVYALGVLLYQIVIGDFNQPFEAVGWEDRLKESLDASGELTRELLRETSPPVEIGDPSRRLASVAATRERLQTLPARRAARQAQRRDRASQGAESPLRRALGVSLAALVVVGGLGVFARMQWRRAKSTPPRAAQCQLALDALMVS